MDLVRRQALILDRWNSAVTAGDAETKANSENELAALIQEMKSTKLRIDDGSVVTKVSQLSVLSNDAHEDGKALSSSAVVSKFSQLSVLSDDAPEEGKALSSGSIRYRIWHDFLSSPSQDINRIRENYSIENDVFRQGNHGKSITSAMLYGMMGITPEMVDFVLTFEKQIKGVSKKGGLEKVKEFALGTPMLQRFKAQLVQLFGFLESKYEKLFKKPRVAGLGGRDSFPLNDRESMDAVVAHRSPPLLPRMSILVYGNENQVIAACHHADLHNGILLKRANGEFFGYIFLDMQRAEGEILRKIEELGEIGHMAFGHVL